MPIDKSDRHISMALLIAKNNPEELSVEHMNVLTDYIKMKERCNYLWYAMLDLRSMACRSVECKTCNAIWHHPIFKPGQSYIPPDYCETCSPDDTYEAIRTAALERDKERRSTMPFKDDQHIEAPTGPDPQQEQLDAAHERTVEELITHFYDEYWDLAQQIDSFVTDCNAIAEQNGLGEDIYTLMDLQDIFNEEALRRRRNARTEKQDDQS